MALMAQFNTRMSANLKEQGDAVLEHYGMSASQAVRQLWEFMATYGEYPRFELQWSRPEGSGDATCGELEELDPRVLEGAGIVPKLLQEHGASWQPCTEEFDRAALQEEMYTAKLAEYEALYE